MLSEAYLVIRRLRINGQFKDAYASLSAVPPTSDDDAFEAAMCLYQAGDIASAINVCQTVRWRDQWARDIAGALARFAQGGGANEALPLARQAVVSGSAPPDAQAFYLFLLRALDTPGAMDEARALIAKRLQQVPASEAGLLAEMMEIAIGLGDPDTAYRHACAIQSLYPRHLGSLYALCLINERIGNHHEALGIAMRVRLLDPKSQRATLFIMRCQNQLGDHYAALGAFDKLGIEKPAETELLTQCAVAFAGVGQARKAIELLKQAVVRPEPSMDAFRVLIGLLALVRDTAGLQALLEQHGDTIRGNIECVLELGLERLYCGQIDESKQWLDDAFALAQRQSLALQALPWPVPEPRVRHDREQLERLDRKGRLNAAGKSALSLLERIHARDAAMDQVYAPAGDDSALLEHALTATHYLPPAACSGQALGKNDYAGIEDAYFAARPPLVVIDNFLSQDALAALREYCEDATIWRMNNTRGYVGALLAQGFSPRVLLDIAHELRMAMPRVIGEHPLTQAWAFKYDQRMQGINMHADFAKVNVNFWITPQSGCADDTRGGMIVYDLPAPASWNFADYNTNQSKMIAFLTANNAQPRRVPYRENRCVLFDSSLIHITDELHFRPGYENRRVNVTLLYGRARALD
jgi:tetratricopeptide (TPR) repeat protein